MTDFEIGLLFVALFLLLGQKGIELLDKDEYAKGFLFLIYSGICFVVWARHLLFV